MSHVDEGLIHAWIDGAFEPGDPEGAAIEAHLSACAECRAGVDAALRLKNRAAEILQSAVPDAVRVEPFERMVRDRRARQAELGTEQAVRQSTRRRPYIPLAWAASIMLAVTAGWFANTMVRPDRPGAPSEAAFEPARAVAPGNRSAATEADQSIEASADAAVADAAAAGGADGRGQTVRQQPDQTGRGGASRERAEAVAPPAAAPPPQASVAKAGSPVLADSLRARLAEAEQEFEARAMSPELVLLQSAGDPDWTALTLAEASSRFGRMPFAIEGLPIESIEMRDSGGAMALRVRQRIGEDATVEIIQQAMTLALDEIVVLGAVRSDSGIQATGARDDSARRAALARADSSRRESMGRQLAASADRSANEAAPSLPLLVTGDTAAIRVPTIGYTVVLRGALAADSLRALVMRVR